MLESSRTAKLAAAEARYNLGSEGCIRKNAAREQGGVAVKIVVIGFNASSLFVNLACTDPVYSL